MSLCSSFFIICEERLFLVLILWPHISVDGLRGAEIHRDGHLTRHVGAVGGNRRIPFRHGVDDAHCLGVQTWTHVLNHLNVGDGTVFLNHELHFHVALYILFQLLLRIFGLGG